MIRSYFIPANHFFIEFKKAGIKYDQKLFYSCLFEFDKEMIGLIKTHQLFSSPDVNLLCIHEDDKVIAFERNKIIFVFNFHPSKSFPDYMFVAPKGEYRMILNSDEKRFGGEARLKQSLAHFTIGDPNYDDRENRLSLYLPNRSAIVLNKAHN